MKRIVYILLLFCIYTTSLTARTPIRQWFTDMPDSIMPLLTKNNRLDFIDFIDSHMDAIVTNRLDGKSRMTQLTEDYLHIEYTQSSSVTMKLLPTSRAIRSPPQTSVSPVNTLRSITAVVPTRSTLSPTYTRNSYMIGMGRNLY